MNSKLSHRSAKFKKDLDPAVIAHIYDIVDKATMDKLSARYWMYVDQKKMRAKSIMQKRYQMAMRKMRSRWQYSHKPRRSQDPLVQFPELSPEITKTEQYRQEMLKVSLALNLNDMFMQLSVPFEVKPENAQETSLFMLRMCHGFLLLCPDLSQDARVIEQQKIFNNLCLKPTFRSIQQHPNISLLRQKICCWDRVTTQQFYDRHQSHVSLLLREGLFKCSSLETEFRECINQAVSRPSTQMGRP